MVNHFELPLKIDKIRVEFFGTDLTDTVAKISLGVVAYIAFYLFPVTITVADFFATGTNGDNPLEDFYFCNSLSKL